MGNVTKTKPLPSKRNTNEVERQLNAIRRRLPQLKNEVNALQTAFKKIGTRIKSGAFNERDVITMELIPRRMQEIVHEKQQLINLRAKLVRHQLTYGF